LVLIRLTCFITQDIPKQLTCFFYAILIPAKSGEFIDKFNLFSGDILTGEVSGYFTQQELDLGYTKIGV